MRFLKVLSAMVFLGVSGSSVLACQFEDVVTDSCPSVDVGLPTTPEGQRAALSSERLWSKFFPKFNKKPKHLIEVCFFEKQAKNWKGEIPVNIAKLRAKQFEAAMKRVESVANQWNTAELKIGDKTYTSRVKFNFKEKDGQFRKCEAAAGSHVRVMFNRSNYHRTLIGTDNARTTGWSMTLGVASNGRAPVYTVLHELGHALGYIHEMGHTKWQDCAAAFDPNSIWRRGMFGEGLTKEEELEKIDQVIVKANSQYKKLSETKTFDPHSTMTYHIPETAFGGKAGCALAGKVETLSKGDRLRLIEVYGVEK